MWKIRQTLNPAVEAIKSVKIKLFATVQCRI